MSDPKHPIWDVIKVLGVCAICVGPFYLLANDLSDGDEIVKSFGVAIVGAIVAVPRIVAAIHQKKE